MPSLKYSTHFDLDCIFSYGNGGKSGEKPNPEINNTYYMNAGIAYHSDSRKLSLTYFNSGRDIAANELTSYALSLEYPFFYGHFILFRYCKI